MALPGETLSVSQKKKKTRSWTLPRKNEDSVSYRGKQAGFSIQGGLTLAGAELGSQ